MYFGLLGWLIMHLLGKNPEQQARDREAQRKRDAVERLLRSAERRQLNQGRNLGKRSLAKSNNAFDDQYEDDEEDEAPRVRKSSWSGRNLLVVLAVLGGLAVLVLLSCSGIAIGTLIALNRNNTPTTVAAKTPTSPTEKPPAERPPQQRVDRDIPNPQPPVPQPPKPPEVDEPNDEPPFRAAPAALPAAVEFADAPADLPPIKDINRPLPAQSSTIQDLDLKTVVLNKARLACWTPDGRGFYLIQKETGVVSRIALDTLTVRQRLSTGRGCGWISLSSLGPVLTFPAHHECWLLDPDSLQVRFVVRIPRVERVVSAPALTLAYAFTSDQKLVLLDLEKRVGSGLLPSPSVFCPTITRDGKYLFAGNGEDGGAIQRYRLDGTKILFEEASPEVGNNGARGAVCVSDDGRFACRCSGGGNAGTFQGKQLPIYSTLIFGGNALKTPLCFIRQGAYPRLAAFDSRRGKVYAVNFDNMLLVFDTNGTQEKSYPNPERGGIEEQILVHPDGGKVLLLYDKRLFLGVWRNP